MVVVVDGNDLTLERFNKLHKVDVCDDDPRGLTIKVFN